jgi:hypothetical protein
MNLYEILIQRGESVQTGPASTDRTVVCEPIVQLVLAELAGETATGGLTFANEDRVGRPVATFAPGQWLSFRCAQWNVKPTPARKLRNNDGVWS